MTLVADRWRIVGCGLLLSLLLVLSGCAEEADREIKLTGATMGTSYHVTLVDLPPGFDPGLLQAQLDARLEYLNRTFSTYLDDSELNRLNRHPVGEWFSASDALFDVLLVAMEVALLSEGAFDVTVGPLVDLWGFGPEPGPVDTVPPAEDIDRLLQATGYSHLELDYGTAQVRKKAPLRIDLSAIAKGYAVDDVAALLQREGIANYLVEVGGEVRVLGHNARGEPWRIGIETPTPGQRQLQQAVRLSASALATSGDYRNYFEVDGKRYSHTIDPLTGRPIEHSLASVTVVHDSGAYADALATALNVLGPQRGQELAQQLGLAAYFIVRTEAGFDTRYTEPFEPLLD